MAALPNTLRSPIATAAPRPTLPVNTSKVARAWAWVALALTVHRERRALARIDRHALADLGISVSDASKEVARPFWDLPERRL